MDIRELRYFAAVYRERNLTAAARVCFVSQPSISTAITHLEAELGTTLFIRHKKGVAPTASAEQFHTLARRIIDETDAARSLFRRPSTKTNVTLGLMRTLDVPRTIALLKPLTARADIALRLVGSDERADARIISKSMLRADEHFVALWSERYVAALPPSHPLALKEKLRTADLARVPLIDRCHCEQSGNRKTGPWRWSLPGSASPLSRKAWRAAIRTSQCQKQRAKSPRGRAAVANAKRSPRPR
jgi:DNA-binding transcriptional LysR family regulator